MIRAENLSSPYQVHFDNDAASAIADTTTDNGGSDTGFRPHELLEAALATCMVMTLRMYAERHNLGCEGIGVEVSLNRADQAHPLFECAVTFPVGLPEDRRARMLEIAGRCPVHKTLASALAFKIVSQG